jgi:putative membrane protein
MWGLIVAILIAILIAGFASLNANPVSINLLFWKAPEISLAIVVLISVLVGVVVAALFGIPGYFKDRKKIRSLEKRIKELESGEIKDEEKEEQSPTQD